MNKIRIAGCCIVLLLGGRAAAQFTLNAELRPRTEYSHGFATLASEGQQASLFTTQRTRLICGWKQETAQAKMVLQDVRLWGSQAQLGTNEDYAVSIHEAWAEVKLFDKVSLKAGRQELVYDDSRILGNVAWAQQGRAHDLALLKYQGNFEAHLGLAYYENSIRTNNNFDGANAYKALQFIWLHQQFDRTGLSFLILNNGVAQLQGTKQKIVYSQTIGSHLKTGLTDELSLNANLYYQTGKLAIQNGTKTLAAFNLMLEAVYKTGDLNWTLGYEVLSGNQPSDTTRITAFNPLYGTNHKFNGYMDYFYVGNHLNSAGLQDAYLKGSLNKKRWNASADVHLFLAHQPFNDQTAGMLGTELDLNWNYKLSDKTTFTAGYSQLFATNRMQALKGGNSNENQNWAYLMCTFLF